MKTIEIIKEPDEYPIEFVVNEELIERLKNEYKEQTYDTGGVNFTPSHKLRIGRLPQGNIPK